jgi:hypothetical protein
MQREHITAYTGNATRATIRMCHYMDSVKESTNYTVGFGMGQ